MMYFCTLFNAPFALKGLALLKSLRDQGVQFRLWVLALDEETERLLGALMLPEIAVIPLARLEATFPELLAARGNRTFYEYICTCKPFLMRYILATHQEADVLSFCDSDLFFSGDPWVITQEIEGASVLLTPHRFPEGQKHKADKVGTYNAGFLVARNDADGDRVLRHWSDRVIEWCKDKVEDGKFIDQKYLDGFPALSPRVRSSSHAGLNSAPWNFKAHPVSSVEGRWMAGDQSLIFVHVHALKRIGWFLYDPAFATYGVRGTPSLRALYQKVFDAFSWSAECMKSAGLTPAPQGTVRVHENGWARVRTAVRALMRRQLLVVWNGHIVR